MSAFEFCQQDVAPRFSDWAFASASMSATQQAELFGVLSYAQRVADIPHRASEMQVATAQISWWQQQLAAVAEKDGEQPYKNLAATEITIHPSLVAMQSLLQREPEALSWLTQLLEHANEDLQFAGFQQESELMHFWQHRHQPLWSIKLAVFRQPFAEPWLPLAALAEWVQVLKRWPTLMADGVVYLPESWLTEQQLTISDLVEKKAPNALPILLANISSRMRNQANAALISLSAETRTQTQPLLRWLHLQNAWLKATERAGFPLYEYRLELGSLQKRFVVWRAPRASF